MSGHIRTCVSADLRVWLTRNKQGMKSGEIVLKVPSVY